MPYTVKWIGRGTVGDQQLLCPLLQGQTVLIEGSGLQEREMARVEGCSAVGARGLLVFVYGAHSAICLPRDTAVLGVEEVSA